MQMMNEVTALTTEYISNSKPDNVPERKYKHTKPSQEQISYKDLLTGVFLALLSSLLFTTNGVILQKLNLNFSDVNLVRYSLQTVVMFLVIKIKNKRMTKEDGGQDFNTNIWPAKADPGKNLHFLQSLLILQGIFNGFIGIGEAIGMTFMPIGDASAIIFSSPLPSMLLSRAFLKERLGLYKIICGLVLYLGVVLVLQPPILFGQPSRYVSCSLIQQLATCSIFSPEKDILEKSENLTSQENGPINNMYYFGAVMGLVAAWARSVNFVSCKVLFKNKSTSSTDLIILYAGFGGLIVSLMSSILDKNSQILSSQFAEISLMKWGGMLATAVQCIIAVVSLNAALVVTGPVLVSFVRVNDIILAYFIQIVFFHQVPVVIGLVGSFCVVGAVICLPLEQLAVKFTPQFIQKIL